MPRKLRELIFDLKKAGFVQFPGRGSHRKFKNEKGLVVILSGHHEGEDAKPYQEEIVRTAIEEAKKT